MEGLLVRVSDVYKHFPVRRAVPILPTKQYVRAVDGVSLDIRANETVSIVGESGSGKTTLAKLILLLERPTAGSISSLGHDVHRLHGSRLKEYRSLVQAVFQDPWSSMNPRMQVGSIIAEPLIAIAGLKSVQLARRVDELLEEVGLDRSLRASLPHELSGGMRQRVAVARALALRPSLIVLDEPISSLDVSIAAQIMTLLKDLQTRHGIAYILITHNLAHARFLSHSVHIMYMGQVIESGSADRLFAEPKHPYTRALLAAASPAGVAAVEEEMLLFGDVSSAIALPPGCRFHPRCPQAFARCSVEVPTCQQGAEAQHVICHLYAEPEPKRTTACTHM